MEQLATPSTLATPPLTIVQPVAPLDVAWRATPLAAIAVVAERAPSSPTTPHVLLLLLFLLLLVLLLLDEDVLDVEKEEKAAELHRKKMTGRKRRSRR